MSGRHLTRSDAVGEEGSGDLEGDRSAIWGPGCPLTGALPPAEAPAAVPAGVSGE